MIGAADLVYLETFEESTDGELADDALSSLERREKVKLELFALAEEILAGWDTYETVISLPEVNYIAKQSMYGDVPLTVMKMRCEGMTEKIWAKYTEDPSFISTAVNPKLKRIVLPDEYGYRVRLLKMSMPIFVTNRSTLATYYRHELDDGT